MYRVKVVQKSDKVVSHCRSERYQMFHKVV